MSLLGNIIWFIFGGLVTAIEYFITSLFMFFTIIGIPFGLQTMKLGVLTLWPFGRNVVAKPARSGCLFTLLNIIWLIGGGILICLSHLLFGLLLFVTIIGIPFGRQHFKLARLALTPFNYEIR